MVDASGLLGLSYRQTKRVWSRYREEGDAGLLHRGRGRLSNRQPDAERKERALELYQQHLADYGPTLAAEVLAEEHHLSVPVSTLRRWLVDAGLWLRQRKRRKHRRRRDRREHRGDLVQLDGSHHDWFEGRRASSQEETPYAGWAVLMVMIDDATGQVFARFYENESWRSAADIFQHYARTHGLPRGLYVDQHGIYRPGREATGDEIIADLEPETQFGRAMRELDVELIMARSPQAKGRVERMNSTLQDRLVKALRRKGVCELEAANQFLEEQFLPAFNTKFVIKPASDKDWHTPVTDDTQLEQRLSVQEPRTVQRDWTVRWFNQAVQLACEAADVVQPGQKVTLCQQLDGQLRVFAGNVELPWSSARSYRPPQNQPPPITRGPTGSSQGYKPPPDHPWR